MVYRYLHENINDRTEEKMLNVTAVRILCNTVRIILLPIIIGYLYFHITITRNHLLKQPKTAATPDAEERALLPKNNKK